MIKSKAQFYKEQREGRCWNYFPQYTSYDALVASGYCGLVNIRDLVSGRRSKTKERYKVPVAKIPKALRCKDANVGFFPTPPDEKIILQGEFGFSGGVAELRYTFVKKPMLLAFKEQDLRATGLSAILIMKKYLWELDLSAIYDVIDRFTDHTMVDTPIVEFTAYSIRVGIFGRFCVVWECRAY